MVVPGKEQSRASKINLAIWIILSWSYNYLTRCMFQSNIIANGYQGQTIQNQGKKSNEHAEFRLYLDWKKRTNDKLYKTKAGKAMNSYTFN